MRIFSSLVVGAVAATDCSSGDFCVISCNDANNNNATAMTISVDQDYMEQHHNALTLGSKKQKIIVTNLMAQPVNAIARTHIGLPLFNVKS